MPPILSCFRVFASVFKTNKTHRSYESYRSYGSYWSYSLLYHFLSKVRVTLPTYTPCLPSWSTGTFCPALLVS